MPVYEYRCRVCDDRFELRRSAAAADDAAPCPAGHAESVRLLSVFAATGRAGSGPAAGAAPAPAAPCGGHCVCH